jgi:hypothetical protein
MGQNLRAMFRVDFLPPVLQNLISLYQRVFRSDLRGEDILAFDERFKKMEECVIWTLNDLSTLSNSEYQLFWNHISHNNPGMAGQPIVDAVYNRMKICRLGQTFQTANTLSVDSKVFYRNERGERSAGDIVKIFSHSRKMSAGQVITETFVIIHDYTPVSLTQLNLDHYRELQHTFPPVGFLLFKSSRSSHRIISIDNVDCHLAYYPFDTGQDLLMGLPLNKVMYHQILKLLPQLIDKY